MNEAGMSLSSIQKKESENGGFLYDFFVPSLTPMER